MSTSKTRGVASATMDPLTTKPTGRPRVARSAPKAKTPAPTGTASPSPTTAPRKPGAPKGAKTTHYVPAVKRRANVTGDWLRIEEAQAILGVGRPKMVKLLQTVLEPYVHYSVLDDRIKLLPRDVIEAMAKQPHERAGESTRPGRSYEELDRMREVALKKRGRQWPPRPSDDEDETPPEA